MKLEDVTIRSREELLSLSRPVLEDLDTYLKVMNLEIINGPRDDLEELYHDVNNARSMLLGCVDVESVQNAIFQRLYLKAKTLRDAIRFGCALVAWMTPRE